MRYIDVFSNINLYSIPILYAKRPSTPQAKFRNVEDDEDAMDIDQDSSTRLQDVGSSDKINK